jgi:nucleoside-diphosphate-sugar epimerase
MQSVSIVGCGYTGLRLASRWVGSGARVRGFATRDATLSQITAAGVTAARLDLDAAVAPIEVAGQWVYYTVPPAKAEGDPRLQSFLDALVGLPRRMIYFSTTGVYGDRGGATVNEETPPAPLTARAQRRLSAENALRAWADARQVSWCILRVPGIYGPGRLPLDRLRRREPAIRPPEAGPGNRIHVDDLVTVCMAAALSARADGRISNVTDGSEDSLTQYLQRVAGIANLPPPPLVSREEARRAVTESSWSFLAESRRVDNRRMLEELGVALAYHDLDAGIRASLAAERAGEAL